MGRHTVYLDTEFGKAYIQERADNSLTHTIMGFIEGLLSFCSGLRFPKTKTLGVWAGPRTWVPKACINDSEQVIETVVAGLDYETAREYGNSLCSETYMGVIHHWIAVYLVSLMLA